MERNRLMKNFALSWEKVKAPGGSTWKELAKMRIISRWLSVAKMYRIKRIFSRVLDTDI